MISTVRLHPALFARAWLNLMPVAKMGDEYENMILLEEHALGVWLVAMSPRAFAASWCPFEPADEQPPSFSEAPINPPVLIGDGDGRIADLCKYEWKRWKKNALDAGLDEYIVISPTVVDPGKEGQALPGLERVNVRVRTLTEHVDTIEVQKPCPDWASTFRTLGNGTRETCMLSMDTLKALSAIDGCRDPRVEFGAGAQALLTFEPDEGVRPVTFVAMAVGKREAAESPAPAQLVQQSFDVDTRQWSDAEDEDDDDSFVDPSLKLAANAAQTALASLVGS